MKLLFTLVGFASVLYPIYALPPPAEHDVGAQITVIGPGCSWCETPLAWSSDASCADYEYSAVASSLRNPPSNITFDASAFCSEFLKPLITQVSTFFITSSITTTTIEIEYLTLFTPKSTATGAAMSMDMGMPGMNMGPPAAASVSASAAASKTGLSQVSMTAAPSSKVVPALAKRDFTVPDYIEPWYYYGRVDPACSCIITSANPPVHFSANETDTVYSTTISITTTITYTIYP